MLARLLLLVSCALIVGVTTAFAQPPAPIPASLPEDGPSEEPTKLLDRIKEPDQGGGLHFTKHWAVAFGGIKQGSSIALGPAFSTKFDNGAYLQLKAVFSVRKFKVLQGRFDTGRFWNDKAVVVSRVRWQDAPELKLFRLGINSPDENVDYAERKTEVSSQLRMRLRPHFGIAAGFGVERFSTRAGDLHNLPAFPDVPGLATHPWFGHGLLVAAYDTRTSPDYSISGHVVGAAVHNYHDFRDNQDGFQMYEVGAQQLVPMASGRGVLDLSGRTWMTSSSGPLSVPFYLMPTLGGADYLRAFPTYRFRDRDAWYVKTEYRWAVHKMADVAGFYEGGEVSPTVGDFSFDDVANSVGLGIRVHSKTASLFRVDAAHGREGWGFRVGFNAGGS